MTAAILLALLLAALLAARRTQPKPIPARVKIRNQR